MGTQNALTSPKTVPWSSASIMPKEPKLYAENIAVTAIRKAKGRKLISRQICNKINMYASEKSLFVLIILQLFEQF